jgi:subtilisin family serine protease
MIWRIACTAIALVTALGQAQDRFDLRVPPNASIETLRFIASIAEPRTETVPASMPLPDLLRKYYGAAPLSFRKIFLDYNPGFGKSSAGVTNVIIPVLPKWSLHPTVLGPAKQNTVQQLLCSHLGYCGKRTREQVAALNSKIVGLYERAAVSLRVPYTTDYFLVKLKPELRPKAEEIYGRLLALRAQGQILRVGNASRLRGPPQFEAADVPRTVPPHNIDPNWAFQGLGSNVLGPKANTVTIAIADSGIDQESDGHPDARFVYWQGPPPGIDTRQELGVPTCGNVQIGCNFVKPHAFPLDDTGQIDEPSQDDKPRHAYHGTHVSGVAFARLAEQLKPDLDSRLRLMVLKVMDKEGYANSDAMASALLFADQHPAQVVNLSLSGRRTPDVERLLEQLKSHLFVIAAGNQEAYGAPGLDLDLPDPEETAGYPARLAGVLPNVITVAAHDEAGNLAPFSNWGSTAVTMAAPGVNIRSTIPGKDKYLALSGTSQAAPVVSLAAALLIASGLGETFTPGAIKRRLIASVGVTDALRDRVQSHGKLNIARALAWHYDSIKLRTGDEPLKGIICSPSGLSMPDRDRVDWRYVSKIVLNYSPDAGRHHYVMLRKGNTDFQQWIGDLDLTVFTEISFSPGMSGCDAAQPIKTTEILDITTQYY